MLGCGCDWDVDVILDVDESEIKHSLTEAGSQSSLPLHHTRSTTKLLCRSSSQLIFTNELGMIKPYREILRKRGCVILLFRLDEWLNCTAWHNSNSSWGNFEVARHHGRAAQYRLKTLSVYINSTDCIRNRNFYISEAPQYCIRDADHEYTPSMFGIDSCNNGNKSNSKYMFALSIPFCNSSSVTTRLVTIATDEKHQHMLWHH